MHQTIKIIIIVSILFNIIGCTAKHVLMYPGKPLPQDKISRITVNPKYNLSITRIDGENMSFRSALLIRSAELLPGEHIMTVGLLAGNETFVTHSLVNYIKLETVAGTNYLINASLHLDDKNRWLGNVWVEEEASNKVVGGLLDHEEAWKLHKSYKKTYDTTTEEPDDDF